MTSALANRGSIRRMDSSGTAAGAPLPSSTMHSRFDTEQLSRICSLLFASAAEGLVVVDGMGTICSEESHGWTSYSDIPVKSW
jgi:hypothetical protein